MSLSNTTLNLLRTQYYDDFFNQSNVEPTKLQGEVNDFHRILFRPRYAVQSRELTQIQTILQAQLERLGKSQFADGDAVSGGHLTLDTSVTAGRVLPATNLVAFFDRTTNLGKNIFDTERTTSRAHVLQYVSADEGTTTDSYLVYNQKEGSFSPGTVVQASDDASVRATFASAAASEIFYGASLCSIDEGIFFVSGFYVYVPKQTIVLSPFSNKPSFRIGLEIQEQVLDELDAVVGDSLLDPTNSAPGAHRFRIRLTLGKRGLATAADPMFIELARVENGVLQQKPDPGYVRMRDLLSILARRTYDESGDYVVRPFSPVIETDPNDEAQFVLALGPGKAYVQGYEIDTKEPTKLEVRKGRVTANATNRSLPLTVGNFVYVARLQAGQPANYFANTALVDVHCVNVASINLASNTAYWRSHVGTAKIRMVELESAPTDITLFANNSVYRLFYYDVQFDSLTGNVANAAQNSANVDVRIAIGRGFPQVNDALVGATIILGGDASPVTGTFTVNAYTTNASCATIQFKEFLPTLPNANTTYRLLVQPRDIDSFALYDTSYGNTAAPFVANLAFQADVHATSKVGGFPTGFSITNATTDNALLFQIPETFVKANTITSNTALWVAWLKTVAGTGILSSASNVSVTISVSGAAYSLPTGDLSAATARDSFIIFDQTADGAGRGCVIGFKDSPLATDRCISNVVVAQVGSTYNITFLYHHGSSVSCTRSFVGLARTEVVGLAPRTKTLIIGNSNTAYSNTTSALGKGQVEYHSLNTAPGAVYSLMTSDVFRLAKVLYKDANTAFSNTDMSSATDVTSHFTLDTGQRDNTYEFSQVLAGPRAASAIKPTGRLLFIFDWFQHAGRGYVSLDSYLSSGNVLNGMTYDLIPSYTSAKFQRTINLRDVLDFRPVRSNIDTANTALVFAAGDSTGNTTYLNSDNESYLSPVSDDVWLGSYQYYLSRIDKVAVGYDGVFQIIEGADAVTPSAPGDAAGHLLLYQLNIPPYTLVDANGTPTGVSLRTFEHKRFTMQDLSKMDDRVAHLEYYTALNSLEQITRDEALTDVNGQERFKNGILVDSFHGGDVAEVTNPDFTASIDGQNRELRTAFDSFVVGFAADLANSTSYGITLVGDMAIPTYNVAAFVTQALATHSVSVNPFDVASFYGNLKLSPAVDIWKSTSTKPAQVIDLGGPSEAWMAAEKPSFVNWGEWEQTWSGVSSVVPRAEFLTPPGWTPENHGFRSMTALTWNDVSTAALYQRQGTAYEYTVTKTSASLGNKVVDVNIIHNMRARDIVFASDGLKPQANLYAFFDGSDVSNYMQEANELQLAEVTGSTTSPFHIGQTVWVKKAVSGTVATTLGVNSVTGTSTVFQYELTGGALLSLEQGVQTFNARVGAITSNTALTLNIVAPVALANAVIYTLTPMTVADVSQRISGNNVQYTLKVVRAVRDSDHDSATPYTIIAGSLRPEKQVNDSANTTTGAALLVPASARANSTSFTITGARCVSGVVRAWNSSAMTLRFDTDVTDDAVDVGTTVRIVSGPGAGTSANVVSYSAATQTATLDNALAIVAEKSIYSIGQPVADGTISGNTVSGRAGTFAGVFHLPEGAFAVGTRLLRLTDSPTNTVREATTSAEANYEASGLSYTNQETSVSSRSLGLVRAGVRKESLRVDTGTSQSDIGVQYVDPLAETFLVDAKQYPQGVFITSVDLCFEAVPTDDVPVIVEIRNVVNGYPSSNQIVPCCGADGMAVCTLRPDQVKTAAVPSFGDPLTVTRFTFAAPVHLMPGREYAIVIRSDSDAYRVYTAELGALVLGSDGKVSKQPYAGSFFKSQNASAWTESPFEDLMFRLNRAVWDASEVSPATGVLVARAIAPAANLSFDSYELYPHDVTFGGMTSVQYQLDIKPMNTTTLDLTGQVAVRYDVQPETWSLVQARSMMQGMDGRTLPDPFGGAAIPLANTADALITLTTRSTDVAPYIDLKKFNLLGVRHLINDMALAADDIQIVHPGAGYLVTSQTGTVATTSGNAVVTGTGTAFTNTLAVGDTVVIGGNVEVVVYSVANDTSFTATATVTATRAANSYFTYGTKGGNNAVVLAIAGGNGTNAAGYATVGRNGKLSGVVLTANGTGYTGTAAVTVANASVVAGYTLAQTGGLLAAPSEVAARGGVGLTRYITRPVTLADGFDARDLYVIFDAYRPLDSHFHVYYKVLPGDGADTVRFEDQPWRPMTMETSESTFSTSYYGYKEFRFVTPNGRALDQSTDTTDKFKVFAIKVVMASTDTVDTPRIANFRAVALDE